MSDLLLHGFLIERNVLNLEEPTKVYLDESIFHVKTRFQNKFGIKITNQSLWSVKIKSDLLSSFTNQQSEEQSVQHFCDAMQHFCDAVFLGNIEYSLTDLKEFIAKNYDYFTKDSKTADNDIKQKLTGSESIYYDKTTLVGTKFPKSSTKCDEIVVIFCLNMEDFEDCPPILRNKLSISSETKFSNISKNSFDKYRKEIFKWRQMPFTEITDLTNISFIMPIHESDFLRQWVSHIDSNFKKIKLNDKLCFAVTSVSPYGEPRLICHNSVHRKDRNERSLSLDIVKIWLFDNRKLRKYRNFNGVEWKYSQDNQKFASIIVRVKEPKDLIISFNVESIKVDELSKINKVLTETKDNILSEWIKTFESDNDSYKSANNNFRQSLNLKLENLTLNYHVFLTLEDLTEVVSKHKKIINHYFQVILSNYQKLHLKFHPKFLRDHNSDGGIDILIKVEITNKNTILISIQNAKELIMAQMVMMIFRYMFEYFAKYAVKSTKELKHFDPYLFCKAVNRGGYTRSCTNPKNTRNIPELNNVTRIKRPVPINLNNPFDKKRYESLKHPKPVFRYRNVDYACINDEIANHEIIENYNKKQNNPKKKIKYYNMPFLKELDPEKYHKGSEYDPDKPLFYPCCEMDKKSLSLKKLDTLRKAYKQGLLEIHGIGAKQWLDKIKSEKEFRRGDIVHYITNSYSYLSIHHYAHLPSQLEVFFRQNTRNYKKNKTEFIRKGVLDGKYQLFHAVLELTNYHNYTMVDITEKRCILNNLLQKISTKLSYHNYRCCINKMKKNISFSQWKELILGKNNDNELIDDSYVLDLLGQYFRLNFLIFDFDFDEVGGSLLNVSNPYYHKKKCGLILKFRNSYESIIFFHQQKQVRLFGTNFPIIQRILNFSKPKLFDDLDITELKLRSKGIKIIAQVVDEYNKTTHIITDEPSVKHCNRDDDTNCEIISNNNSTSNHYVCLPVIPSNPKYHLPILKQELQSMENTFDYLKNIAKVIPECSIKAVIFSKEISSRNPKNLTTFCSFLLKNNLIVDFSKCSMLSSQAKEILSTLELHKVICKNKITNTMDTEINHYILNKTIIKDRRIQHVEYNNYKKGLLNYLKCHLYQKIKFDQLRESKNKNFEFRKLLIRCLSSLPEFCQQSKEIQMTLLNWFYQKPTTNLIGSKFLNKRQPCSVGNKSSTTNQIYFEIPSNFFKWINNPSVKLTIHQRNIPKLIKPMIQKPLKTSYNMQPKCSFSDFLWDLLLCDEVTHLVNNYECSTNIKLELSELRYNFDILLRRSRSIMESKALFYKRKLCVDSKKRKRSENSCFYSFCCTAALILRKTIIIFDDYRNFDVICEGLSFDQKDSIFVKVGYNPCSHKTCIFDWKNKKLVDLNLILKKNNK